MSITDVDENSGDDADAVSRANTDANATNDHNSNE